MSAAPREPVPDAVGRFPQSSPRVIVGEGPPLALTLIERLDVGAVVLSLFVCLLAFDEPLTLGYLVVAVISLVLSSRMLTPPDLRGVLNYGAVPSRVVARTMLEWGAVCGLLLLLGFSLKVSEEFSRSVMLTWFSSRERGPPQDGHLLIVVSSGMYDSALDATETI